jgi:hypothetical protein
MAATSHIRWFTLAPEQLALLVALREVQRVLHRLREVHQTPAYETAPPKAVT